MTALILSLFTASFSATLIYAEPYDSRQLAESFLKESTEYPSQTLALDTPQIKVSKRKHVLVMDAVILVSHISNEKVFQAASQLEHYPAIQVPGVLEVKKLNPSYYWLHSATMGIHSKNFVELGVYPNLSNGTARGMIWIPTERQKDWTHEVSGELRNFTGSYFLKAMPGDQTYIRYAMTFELSNLTPAWIAKLILEFKGKKLSTGYLNAILNAAQL